MREIRGKGAAKWAEKGVICRILATKTGRFMQIFVVWSTMELWICKFGEKWAAGGKGRKDEMNHVKREVVVGSIGWMRVRDDRTTEHMEGGGVFKSGAGKF